MDRRQFLKLGAAQAALVGAGGLTAPGCATHPGAPPVEKGENPFRHGVASGDPLLNGVLIWTRASPEVGRLGDAIDVDWWIGPDASGANPVKTGTVQAGPERDFTVKSDVRGLEHSTEYYYGFSVGAHRSPVGRTRTMPKGHVEGIRLALTSCSNYPQGYFNAYAAIAARDDLDAVVHLGDYLYEYGNGEYGDGTALGRVPDPEHEILTLEDYRRRHAIYKTDPDLQAAHARYPWLPVWDDHESANNAWVGGAENHASDGSEGDWQARKLAAMRAYSEWMPIRDLPTGIFRVHQYGDLTTLIMLDTRLRGRDEQGSQDDHALANDPERRLLDAEQETWLEAALVLSKLAETSWRVIGQQVFFSPMTDGSDQFNPDSWDGYRENRRRVLDMIARRSPENVVVLTGDVHSSWALEVPGPIGDQDGYDAMTGQGARAVEFVVPAVSSPTLGESVAAIEGFEEALDKVPHLMFRDLERNGYTVLDLNHDRVRAEWYFTGPRDIRSSDQVAGPVFETKSGTNHLVQIEEGA